MCHKEKKCSYCNKEINVDKNTFCSDECADKAYNEYMTTQFKNMLNEQFHIDKTFRDTVLYHMK